MTLIRRDGGGAHVAQDSWIAVADGEPLPDGDVLVSLSRWRGEREALGDRRVGVRVPGDADGEELARELDAVELVAIEFPKFTDGRGYTLARLLRRHGYRGELRAVGDVLRDQLFYMARCGFDTFELAPGRDADDAIAAFRDFTVTYQPAEDHDVAIWRRRSSA